MAPAKISSIHSRKPEESFIDRLRFEALQSVMETAASLSAQDWTGKRPSLSFIDMLADGAYQEKPGSPREKFFAEAWMEALTCYAQAGVYETDAARLRGCPYETSLQLAYKSSFLAEDGSVLADCARGFILDRMRFMAGVDPLFALEKASQASHDIRDLLLVHGAPLQDHALWFALFSVSSGLAELGGENSRKAMEGIADLMPLTTFFPDREAALASHWERLARAEFSGIGNRFYVRQHVRETASRTDIPLLFKRQAATLHYRFTPGQTLPFQSPPAALRGRKMVLPFPKRTPG